MRSFRAGAVAWSLTGLALALVGMTCALVFLNRASIHSLDDANSIEIILPIGFALVGGLVASRLPANPLGWIFLAISLANAIPGTAIQYTRYAVLTQPGAPFSPWIPWFGSLADTTVYPAGLAALALLLIPNGRLLSDGWRLVAWAGALVTVALVVTTQLDPKLFSDDSSPIRISNPVGVPGMTDISQGPLGYALFLGGLGILALAGASVAIRLRRATGDERLQLRWVAYAVAFSVLANIGATLLWIFFLPRGSSILLSTAATLIGFGAALPASFGVAILRYRLYDLDLLLNRTV